MAYRDPAIGAVKPNPVDYLLPGPPRTAGPLPGQKYYGATPGSFGGSSGGYSRLIAPVAVPTYSPPVTRAAPSYTAPNISGIPTYSPPEYKELPTYAAPKWDQGEIDTLSQQRAAPGLRAMRQQVQRVTGRRYDNPQVGRMTLREALQGYGGGIGQVIGAAGSEAANEYGQKYARTSENARAEYASEAANITERNRYMTDLAKTKYGGALTEWEARNEAASRAAEAKYGAATAKWKSDTQYSQEQRGFEDAWERWKKQQTERIAHPEWGGA